MDCHSRWGFSLWCWGGCSISFRLSSTVLICSSLLCSSARRCWPLFRDTDRIMKRVVWPAVLLIWPCRRDLILQHLWYYQPTHLPYPNIVNIVVLRSHNILESINHFPGETGWRTWSVPYWKSMTLGLIFIPTCLSPSHWHCHSDSEPQQSKYLSLLTRDLCDVSCPD